MSTWYEQWPERLRKEEYELMKRFPQFQLKKLKDGRLAWRGFLETRRRRSYTIAVVYPSDFPRMSPQAYPIDPSFPSQFIKLPHTMSDGTLCLRYPSYNSATATALQIALGALAWLNYLEEFIETGAWPLGSDPIYELRPERSTVRNRVFISYCHADTRWLRRLRIHLKPLERDGVTDIWDDTRIAAGAGWKEEIRQAIDAAALAILLISADFLASDFIQTNELPLLLSSAEKEGVVILPVIAGPSRFSETRILSQIQAVNPPSIPLSSMNENDQEQLFVKVSQAVLIALGRVE